MPFWNTDNPAKPRGIKDPNAVLDFPIDWNAWLSDAGDAYSSHVVLINASGTMTVDHTTVLGGIITVWLAGGTVGNTESFTVRITTVGGRIEDRTFYLKIQDR